MSLPGVQAVVIPAHNEARTIRAVARGALQHVSLAVAAGERLALVGPIFIRSQIAWSCASLTGLSRKPL